MFYTGLTTYTVQKKPCVTAETKYIANFPYGLIRTFYPYVWPAHMHNCYIMLVNPPDMTGEGVTHILLRHFLTSCATEAIKRFYSL